MESYLIFKHIQQVKKVREQLHTDFHTAILKKLQLEVSTNPADYRDYEICGILEEKIKVGSEDDFISIAFSEERASKNYGGVVKIYNYAEVK